MSVPQVPVQPPGGTPSLPGALRRTALTRLLARLEGFPGAKPGTEQVATPPQSASGLLWDALGRGDIRGRTVLDLGCGTGILAIGAALLGASTVLGVDMDPEALAVARRNADTLGTEVNWLQSEIPPAEPLSAETVVMNPPFGAQRKHADRPFLECAWAALPPGGSLHMFSNAASQTFIHRWTLGRPVIIEEHQREAWAIPPTFPHHRERRGWITVDRWVLRKARYP